MFPIAAAQTSELYQWNEQQAGLPLEWPAAAQLGGVIALSQRSGRSDIVIGGFAGCAQVLEGLAVCLLLPDYVKPDDLWASPCGYS
jgi:hypothetical protein